VSASDTGPGTRQQNSKTESYWDDDKERRTNAGEGGGGTVKPQQASVWREGVREGVREGAREGVKLVGRERGRRGVLIFTFYDQRCHDTVMRDVVYRRIPYVRA
jgi:hypothetical protein